MSGFLDDAISVGSLGLIDGGDITGSNAADAASAAAGAQAAAAGDSIAFQRESRDLAIDRLNPYDEFGRSKINVIDMMLTPEGRYEMAASNPMLDLALDKTNKAIMSSKASQGLLNSGSTIDELLNNALLTSYQLTQDDINNNFNALNIGQSSAAGSANTVLQTGNAVSDLMTQRGNAIASGIVGSQGAGQAAFNNLLNFGAKGIGAYMGAQ